MIQIVVFVPEDHLGKVKAAMFEAGAGKLGNYDQCCFELHGTGQFRPLPGNDAYIGETGKLEKVKEIRVEMTCEEALLSKVIAAMRRVHPYETPAFYGIKTVGIPV